MAVVQPFNGTRYNPEHVKLGGVLAPPYDVISDAKREELYGRDMRNIVRIDYGERYPDVVDGVDGDYTPAASFLRWGRGGRRLAVDASLRLRRARRAAGVLRRAPSLLAHGRDRAAQARSARDSPRGRVGALGPAPPRADPSWSEAGPARAASSHASTDQPGLRDVEAGRRHRRHPRRRRHRAPHSRAE